MREQTLQGQEIAAFREQHPAFMIAGTTTEEIIRLAQKVTIEELKGGGTQYTFTIPHESQLIIRTSPEKPQKPPLAQTHGTRLTFNNDQYPTFFVEYDGDFIRIAGTVRTGEIQLTKQAIVIDSSSKSVGLQGFSQKAAVSLFHFGNDQPEKIQLKSPVGKGAPLITFHGFEGLTDPDSPTFGFQFRGPSNLQSLPITLPKKIGIQK
jgi:hypothetical protein